MYKYICRRILLIIPMLLIVTIVIFTLVQLAPGDALSGEVDPTIPPEDIERQRVLMGLDDPFYVQYASWLGNVLQGNFGVSQTKHVAVTQLIKERIGNTLFLSFVSLFITLLLAIPIAFLAAKKPYSLIDYASTTSALIGLAIPNFYAGLLAIYVFAFHLGWLPSQGTGTHGLSAEGWEVIVDKTKHVILPALTLGLASTAVYMRYLRSEILEVIGKDFIRTARAKGLSEQQVLYKHTFRNALIPLITLLGFEFGTLVSGAVIIETVFSWPGIGRLFLESIQSRDYPVIMAINILSAVFLFIGNLVADILYAMVDPRIRYH